MNPQGRWLQEGPISLPVRAGLRSIRWSACPRLKGRCLQLDTLQVLFDQSFEIVHAPEAARDKFVWLLQASSLDTQAAYASHVAVGNKSSTNISGGCASVPKLHQGQTCRAVVHERTEADMRGVGAMDINYHGFLLYDSCTDYTWPTGSNSNHTMSKKANELS